MSGRAMCWLLGWLAVLLWQPVQAQTVVKYVHTDALGSVVAMTDASRNVIERREYEPYGYQLTPVVQDGPGYTGHVQDAATGLTYMQQRYYDSQLGLFLSVDPVTAYSNPVGQFHRYRYANNNPYRFTDPDGRQSCPTGTRICMSERALQSRIDKLNSESPKQSNDTKKAAVESFSRNALPLQRASNREISANLEERSESDYRIVDYAYNSGAGAKNEAPVTIYSGSYRWSGIVHTHPEAHLHYQLSGAGAFGRNGKFYDVGITSGTDVSAAFQKNIDIYVVLPNGAVRWLDLSAWINAVRNAPPGEVIYAGFHEKDL